MAGLLGRLGKATGAAAMVGGGLLTRQGELRTTREQTLADKAEERSWDMWKTLRSEKITARSEAVTRKDKATEKIIDVYNDALKNYYNELNPKGMFEQTRLTPERRALIQGKIATVETALFALTESYELQTLLPEEREAMKAALDKTAAANTQSELDDAKAAVDAVGKDKAGAGIDEAIDVGIDEDDSPVLDEITAYLKDWWGTSEERTKGQKEMKTAVIGKFKEFYTDSGWDALRRVIGQESGIDDISDMEAASILISDLTQQAKEKGIDTIEEIGDWLKGAVKYFKGEIERAKERAGEIRKERGLSDTAYSDAARYMAEAADSQDIMEEGGLLGGGMGIIDAPPKYVEGEEIVGDPTVTWSPTDPAELMRQSRAGTQTGYLPAVDALTTGGAVGGMRAQIGKTTATLSDDIPEEATEKLARKERLMGKIKAIIISAEPNRGFQEAWTSISGGKDDPNLTSMRVKDIIKKHGHKAFGAGQFTYKDFMVPQVKKHLGKSQTWLDDQTFDIPFQNMLFTIGIEDAGIDEFLSGTKTAAQFQKALHNTWRALPKTVSTNKGDISDKHGNVVQTPGPEVGSEIMSTWTSQ